MGSMYDRGVSDWFQERIRVVSVWVRYGRVGVRMSIRVGQWSGVWRDQRVSQWYGARWRMSQKYASLMSAGNGGIFGQVGGFGVSDFRCVGYVAAGGDYRGSGVVMCRGCWRVLRVFFFVFRVGSGGLCVSGVGGGVFGQMSGFSGGYLGGVGDVSAGGDVRVRDGVRRGDGFVVR
jgi:hypothetical protein